MLKLTKKMKADIRKLKQDDLVVCSDCGSENVTEKMWVDSNSFISIDGEPYYKYNEMNDGEEYWCDDCHNMTIPVHISEYKKEK